MYPVTLSLLVRLSLFGGDFVWGASCGDRNRANGKASITRDTLAKKKGLLIGTSKPCFVLRRPQKLATALRDSAAVLKLLSSHMSVYK